MNHNLIRKTLFTFCILLFSNYLFSQCPKSIVNCKGQCPRFIDANNDGYCDYTTITEIVNKQIKEVKDTTTKRKVTNIIVKKNQATFIKKETKNTITKVDTTISNDLSSKENKIANESIKNQPIIIKTNENNKISLQSSNYDLIFVSLLTFSLYFTTFFLAKLKKIKKKTHRKIWNMLLLLTFIVSCFFGFFLVLQINYHFLYSVFRTLLYWHVEIGISMTLIALFHILWHLKYFKTYFKSSSSDENC